MRYPDQQHTRWRAPGGRMILWVIINTVAGPFAAASEAVLVAEHTGATAGSQIEIGAIFLNSTNATREIRVPAPLYVRVETPDSITMMELVGASGFDPSPGVLTLTPGEFRTVQFTGTLPARLSGAVVLTALGVDANPLLLEVATGPAANGSRRDDGEAMSLTAKTPPAALSFYGPNYFLVGGDGGLNAKFQLGMKFRLFDDRGPLARRLPGLHNLFFSYSQTSLWNLHEASKPFRDSSYRPTLFFGNYDLARSRSGLWHFGFESGLGHESNGKDGTDSRSINFAFVRPTLMFGQAEGRRFFLAPVVYGYIDKAENPDIEEYRGHVDWSLGYGSKGGWNVWATFRDGTRRFGSTEINVSYPLPRLGSGNLSGWVLLQYFDGYGESLLDYNRRLRSQWRLGLALAL